MESFCNSDLRVSIFFHCPKSRGLKSPLSVHIGVKASLLKAHFKQKMYLFGILTLRAIQVMLYLNVCSLDATIKGQRTLKDVEVMIACLRFNTYISKIVKIACKFLS